MVHRTRAATAIARGRRRSPERPGLSRPIRIHSGCYKGRREPVAGRLCTSRDDAHDVRRTVAEPPNQRANDSARIHLRGLPHWAAHLSRHDNTRRGWSGSDRSWEVPARTWDFGSVYETVLDPVSEPFLRSLRSVREKCSGGGR